MPSYQVTLSDQVGLTLKNGHNLMIVEADSAAEALTVASSHFGGDASWANGTATEVVVGADMGPFTDGDGNAAVWTVEIVITGGASPINDTFVYTCIGADALTDAMDGIVVVLNAHASIANAAWGTPTLTIASGGGGDDLGDHDATCVVKRNGVTQAGFVTSVTSGGISTAALSAAIDATIVIPDVAVSGRI
jgi:hypothetical protein